MKNFKQFFNESITVRDQDDWEDRYDNYTLYVNDKRQSFPVDDRFINGKYSSLTIDSKILILDFFGNDDKVSEYIQGFLSPESSHEEYAEFFGVSIESLQDVYEICTPPDLEKETLIDNNYLLVRLLGDICIFLNNK